MADIKKAIEETEKSIGRELTDREKQVAELFGELMNAVWGETDTIHQNVIERKPMNS